MGTHPIFESDFDCLTDKMNFEPSWAFDKMAFDFPLDPFGTLEVEGGFKGENLFGKCEESFISEMVDETEKKELERIKAKYQNNLGTDYSSFNYSLSHDYQSTAHTPTYSLILGDL